MTAKERPIPVVLLRAVLWRRVDTTSLEHCRLQEFDRGYLLTGRVLTVADAQPIEAGYTIVCDRAWRTTDAHVQVLRGVDVRQVQLRRTEQNEWWRDDERAPELDGSSDIDLGFTPATNTLPIRRLALDVGASASMTAAWVRFPDLHVEALPQRYTRVEPLRYRYESRGGAFTADLDVDDQGLVMRYGQIWERLAP